MLHRHGIICSNFGYKRGHWNPCRQAFHGRCYKVPLEKNPFPIGLKLRLKEETTDGRLEEEAPGWETTEAEQKAAEMEYLCARAGDHFMVPFQCELCHFRNIFYCDPRIPSSQEDRWVMACIVQANLDAFWARRPSTVQGNLQEMNRLMQQAKDMRIQRPMASYPRGPFPVADTLGMVPAIMSLYRLLDKGRNSKTIQWDTMRGMRSMYSNFVHMTPAGTGGAIMSDGRKSMCVTNSTTNSLCFQRFMEGCHKRMGDVRLPDAALTIDVLQALDELWDDLWAEATQPPNAELLHEVASIGFAVTCGFSSGLQGEELGHIRLCELVTLTTQGLQHPQQLHLILAMEGRFKAGIAQKTQDPPSPRLCLWNPKQKMVHAPVRGDGTKSNLFWTNAPTNLAKRHTSQSPTSGCLVS
ncbi:hypothetical protein ACA910_007616 [Epithemia clementina (nom. ined.)]